MSIHLPTINSPSVRQGTPSKMSSFERFHTPSRFSQYVHAASVQNDYQESTPRRLQNMVLPLNFTNMQQQPYDGQMPSPNVNNFNQRGQPSPFLENRNLTSSQYNFLQAKRNQPLQQGSGGLTPNRKQLMRVNSFHEANSPSRSYSPNFDGPLSDRNERPDRPLLPKIESTFKKAANSPLPVLDRDDPRFNFNDAMEQHFQKQSTILEKIANNMEQEKIQMKNYKNERMEHLMELQVRRSQSGTEPTAYVRTEPDMIRRYPEQQQQQIRHSIKPPRLQRQESKGGILQDLVIRQLYKREKNRRDRESDDEDSDSEEDSDEDEEPKKNLVLKTEPDSQTLKQIKPPSNPRTLKPMNSSSNINPDNSMKKALVRMSTYQGSNLISATGGGNQDQDGNKNSLGGKILSNLAWKRLQNRNPASDNSEEEAKSPATENTVKVSAIINSVKPQEKIKSKKEPKIDSKKNNKGEKAKKAESRIQSLMWIVLSFRLIYQDKKKKVYEKKQNIDVDVNNRIAPAYYAIKEFIVNAAGKEIQALLLNKQHSQVFVSTKVIPEKKLEKECTTFKEQFKPIFDSLIKNMSSFPIHVLKFLSSLTENESFLPTNYFTEFELNRLHFGYLGTLKQMNPEKSKLIIGAIVFIRVFVHMVIMQPWDAFSIGKEKFNIEKIFNIGSTWYNFAMELFKASVPLVESSQKVLNLDLKIQPKKKLLNALSDAAAGNEFIIKKDSTRDGEIIQGFYSKQQLACFFSDRKFMTRELKEMMQEWLDAIYHAVDTCKIE